MKLLYSFVIQLYGLALKTAAFFNPKAALWVNGRKGLFNALASALSQEKLNRSSRKLAWFHCASLGEFEQGRPLMEAFRQHYPDHVILLTFFSPSGYEIRKNYSGADLVFYLPLDTRRNAGRFLELVKPDLAFFVKYEFWFNYLRFLQSGNTPTYLISANFRSDQHFFKSYGSWSRNILKGFTHIFVQNDDSASLLSSIGIRQVTVSGDTRLDRVTDIASAQKPLPVIEAFAKDSRVLVAGSTWPADEELITRYLSDHSDSCKLIIAPHEIHEAHILALQKQFGDKPILYSSASSEEAGKCRVLIIDSIGLLSQIYRFGTVAYIGGGFGVGIHNILEAAVYGIPVIFGPNFRKFREANDLVSLKAAFPVRDYREFEKTVSGFLSDQSLVSQAGTAASRYIADQKGATQKILERISA